MLVFVLETFYMVENAREKNVSFLTNSAADYILTAFAIVKVFSFHYHEKSVRILVEKLEVLTKNGKKKLLIQYAGWYF
jgi:hypothetical protein